MRQAKGQVMTTKRWLLDLIDRESDKVRNDYKEMPDKATNDKLAHLSKMNRLRKARQLVEKGPDEP
jgi:hypothetical protein